MGQHKTGYKLPIMMDGCFLKGYVKGQILSTFGKDTNTQMFQLTWAIIKEENKAIGYGSFYY